MLGDRSSRMRHVKLRPSFWPYCTGFRVGAVSERVELRSSSIFGSSYASVFVSSWHLFVAATRQHLRWLYLVA